MKLKPFFSLNVLGVAFLVIAFAFSLVQAVRVSFNSGEGAFGAPSQKKVVRIAHWQLEPGYRDALQAVIDEYNALPHVRGEKVEVRQAPVTEKVYGQWLNVQLMSDTAPDIVERGFAKYSTGQYTAKYFEPIDDLVNEPNPYNAPEYLPPDVPPELAAALARSPWRETFLDGMRGGWIEDLQGYYAVPTSFFGQIRLYYNKKLVSAARALTREALAQSPASDWLRGVFDEGYVSDTPAFRAWVAGDAEPDTLGRLLTICAAIRELGRRTGNDKLVPIAGSKYSNVLFFQLLLVPFTASYADRLDLDLDSTVSVHETYLGWAQSVWSFEDPRVRAFHECINTICKQFPPGFLALERDQANNRFVLGDAGMIASGAWDAASIIHGATSRSRPEDRFEVGIMPLPLPGEGERWSRFTGPPASEAQTTAGAPYQVSQRSRHKVWACDFLRYLTSYRVNQRFNRDAGWIPVILGATPTPMMMPFMPNPSGVFGGSKIRLEAPTIGANIHSTYSGQVWLYMSGDTSYEQLVATIDSTLRDHRSGVSRLFSTGADAQQDALRNTDRMLAVLEARRLLLGDGDAQATYDRAMEKSVRAFGGTQLRAQWHRVSPEQPFPEY